MATSQSFVDFVIEQMGDIGFANAKKMFGEFMIYLNGKAIFLVCNDTVYVKMIDAVHELMQGSECGFPYKGAKEHYVLDVENQNLVREVARVLFEVLPMPKPKKKK